MEQFLEDLYSIHWWLAVVLVGILINIASSYLKKFIEEKLSSFSSKWKYKQEKRAEEERQIINDLSDDYELRLIYALSESRFRIRSVAFLVFGLIFIVFALTIDNASLIIFATCFVFALISIIFGLSDHRTAIKVQGRIVRSTKGLSKINT